MLTTVQNEMYFYTCKSLINLRLENLSAMYTSDIIHENLGHEYDKEIFPSDPLTLSNIPTSSAFNSLMHGPFFILFYFFYMHFCPGTITHAESINSDLQRGLDRRLRHIQH